ncbi:cytochrome P450 [Pisolithus thermaeus]|nr:cytochrome P450 [Pisolithus croceorrhizus]KAI6140053.1 cytochrome P450 [Pisolithus thermaeus]
MDRYLTLLYLPLAAYAIYKRFTRSYPFQVRGPKSTLFLFGFPGSYCKRHLLELYQNMAGEAEFLWKNPYGSVIRVKGILGVAFPRGTRTSDSIAHATLKGHYLGRRVARWMELVNAGISDKIVLDILNWVSRATLDAVGQGKCGGPFDVQLGSPDNAEIPPAKSYQGMMDWPPDTRVFLLRMSIFGTPSVLQIFVQEALKYIAESVVKSWVKYTPNHRVARLHEYGDRKGIVSLAREGEQGYLQAACVILFAGHETTSNTIGWTLLELARKLEIQSIFRLEIRQHESAIHTRGNTQLTASDLENMPFLNAVVKANYILPLSQPITMESGELMHEVLVPKGTRMIASVAAYNCDKDMWGEDADVFNQARWLDAITKDKLTAAGIYSSLLAIRAQPFLVEIFSQFEVSLTEEANRVRRKLCLLVMVPAVEDEIACGVQLPLAISVAPPDDDA